MTLGSMYDNRHLTYGPWSYKKGNRHVVVGEACGGRPWGNSWISLSLLQGCSSTCQTQLSDEKVNQSVRRY